MPKDVYTMQEVMDRLGINKNLAYKAAERGEIPARRVGGRWIVPKAAFDAWLRGEGTNA